MRHDRVRQVVIRNDTGQWNTDDRHLERVVSQRRVEYHRIGAEPWFLDLRFVTTRSANRASHTVRI